MNSLPLRLAVAGLCSVGVLHAQDVLHYKFDDLCSNTVINYASGSPAPSEGTITTNFSGTPGTTVVPGRFGAALAAGDLAASPDLYNYVVTGWNPGTVTGSLSWAAWLHVPAGAPDPSLSYVFGSPSNFRCFINNASSTAGRMQMAGWGGSNLVTTADIRALARAGWVHVALVIDATTNTGTWYVDGVPESPITLSAPMSWSGSVFHVGKYFFDTTPSLFHIDEFFLTLRALTPTDVLVLSATPRAGDGAYGSGGCGNLSLGSTGGRPTLGNTGYALTLNAAYPAGFSVGVGSSRCTIGGLMLPLDLGGFLPGAAGCLMESSLDIANASGSMPAGSVSLPLPIPNVQSLAGLTLYVQTAGVNASAAQLVVSNALAVSLGY